jgi:hypothetical protein
MEIVRVCLEDATTSVVPEIPQLLAPVRSPKASKAGLKCCIFLDFHAPDQCVSCANGHHVSQAALGKYLEVELEKPLEYHQNLQGLKCPQCELSFSGERVSSLVSPDLAKQFQELRERCADKAKYEEEVAGKDDLNTIQECIRLQFRNNKGDYVGCFMCPDCGFGPIDKKACDDMRAHHFQRKGDTFIDNSCPMCHFFAGSISKWNKWDGSFLPGDKVMKMNKIAAKVKADSGCRLTDLQSQFNLVEVDSEAQWAAETAEFQIHLQQRQKALADSGCRVAEDISLEMRGTIDPDRLAELGREFTKSLRIWNPRNDALKYGNVAITVESWVQQKKKALRRSIKAELGTVNNKIHDEVLASNITSKAS